VDIALLKKYFNNECSHQEVEEVLRWAKATGSEAELDQHFKQAWEKIEVEPGKLVQWSKRLEDIHEKIAMEELYESMVPAARVSLKPDKQHHTTRNLHKHSAKQRHYRRVAMMMAASVVAVFLSVFFLFDGPKMISKPQASSPANSMLDKSAEYGQKLTFHLDDGTRVVLNGGSKLLFPASFDADQRVVQLEGEGYFEVGHDAARPFQVVSGDLTITALGTAFNVSALPGANRMEVALVTGKVKVASAGKTTPADSLFLLPGELAAFEVGNNRLTQSSYEAREKIAWKDGVLVFTEADLPEIISKLERWYGVDISTNKPPDDEWSFTAIFDNDNLENVLNALQFGHDMEYTMDGKKVTLKF
jgi:ferric-dicitrate binding protein FerR (iron transport regulator)